MIMDKFNCQYCGKEVIFENDIDVGIRRDDVDCACSECYKKISLPTSEYEEWFKSEWYEMQGSYYG